MELQFITLDVFNTTAYEGNPLAVVLLPHNLPQVLSQDQKQLIAREFNLSETVFLHTSSENSEETQIDIFTPFQELPFAGHPTIGSACFVLGLDSKDEKRGQLRTKAGIIPVSRRKGGDGAVVAEIPHNVHIHNCKITHKLPSPQSGPRIEAEVWPLTSIVKGMTFAMIQLPSLAALAGATKPSAKEALEHRKARDLGWDGEGFIGLYYFVVVDKLGKEVEEGDVTGTGDGVTRLRTRMLDSTMEDPATGSAACALGCYLALTDVGLGGGNVGNYEITQGVEMGRKSIIGVEVEVQDSRKQIKGVKLSGSAVKVMEGKLRI